MMTSKQNKHKHAKTSIYLIIVSWKRQLSKVCLQFAVECVFNCWEVKYWHSGHHPGHRTHRCAAWFITSLNYLPGASTSLRKPDSRSSKWLICYWSVLIWACSAQPEAATSKSALHARHGNKMAAVFAAPCLPQPTSHGDINLTKI